MTQRNAHRSVKRMWFTRAVVALLVVVATGIAVPQVWASARGFYAKIQLLSTIVRLSSEVYVDQVDPEKLMDGAISGMLNELDPHSSYLSPQEAGRLSEKIRGSFGGVGIQYSIVQGVPTVIAVIEGGPAESAGVLAGDRITGVNGATTVGWRMDDVQEHLRGEKGTRVTITVDRSSEPEPVRIEITRGDIPLRSVPYAFMLDDSTGYLRIRNFARTTGIEAGDALGRLHDEGMRYLIIDLRNNGGGDMDAAVAVANYLLPEGATIVSQRGRWEPANETFYATRGLLKLDVPVVAMINRASASASEILAGALQDTDRGLIVGQRSFGKGLVQRPFDLSGRVDNGGVLLLTVARYYTPTGRLIQRDYSRGTAQYLHDNARGEAVQDTANLTAYNTPLGRVVYGGGGIYPDHIVTPREVDRKVVQMSNRALFFRFADEMASENRQFPSDLATFHDMPLDEIWERFTLLALSEDTTLTRNDIDRMRGDIEPHIRAEIAGRFLDSEARYRILLPRDSELAAARGYLYEARTLQQEAAWRSVEAR